MDTTRGEVSSNVLDVNSTEGMTRVYMAFSFGENPGTELPKQELSEDEIE